MYFLFTAFQEMVMDKRDEISLKKIRKKKETCKTSVDDGLIKCYNSQTITFEHYTDTFI